MIRLALREFWIIFSTLLGVSLVAFLPTGWQHTHSFHDFFVHFGLFVQQLLSGDWGVNTLSGNPITTELLRALPASAELILFAMMLALPGGMLLGVFAARYHNRWPDRSIGALTLLGYSVPTFWWAFLLVLLFSLTLMWLPASGRLSFLYDIEIRSGFLLIDTLLSTQPYALEAFGNAVAHLLLPAIVLAFLPLAVIARVTRAALIDSLQSDYVRMARGQGIPESRLLWVYALRNAAVPLLNMLALQLSVFVTCQLLAENIFAWPGIGKWLLDAIKRGDFNAVQFGVMTLCAFIVLVNVLMDILQSRLNPLRWRKRR